MSGSIDVAIRADAGPSIGTGHFARVSAVAEALLASGNCRIALLTDRDGAELAPRFFPREVQVLELQPGNDDPGSAIATLHKADFVPLVLCLDQYGAVPAWEDTTASAGLPLVVFDDLDAAFRADIIVRPHGGFKAGGGGVVLSGPAWLPLANELVGEGGITKPVPEVARRLNVCFGGSDPTGETTGFLEISDALNGLQLDVVIGPGARIDEMLLRKAEGLDHVTLHRAPSRSELAQMLATADMALGAGGVMLWERLYLGVPSLVVATAANQRPQIDSMVEAGAIRFLGDHDAVSADQIVAEVTALAKDAEARSALSKRGRELVDGKGAQRLAAWIQALAFSVHAVEHDDAEDLLAWRTDDSNWEHNWESGEKPSLDSHVAWLHGKLRDPSCMFSILKLGDEAVGVVRFDIDESDSSAYLSIYLVPAWHGRRMGLPVLFTAERALRASHPEVRKIVSRINAANVASEKLHRNAGFVIEPSAERAGWLDAYKSLD